MTRYSPAAFVCAAVLGLAACGGDEPEPGPSTPAVESSTSEDYVAEADALCREIERESEDALPEDPGGDPEAVVEYLTREIEIREDAAAQVAELEAPEELRAQVDEYGASNAEIVARTEDMIAAAEANDGQAFDEAEAERSQAFHEREEIADEIGFEFCGRAPSGPEGS